MQFRIFEKSVYENRRSVLKKKVGAGLLLFIGNEESSMNYKDNWYPFRQDSNFLYYFFSALGIYYSREPGNVYSEII